MKIKLTLVPESYLLTGSGEGSALIDSDIVFHKTGFPYIPARRVKGMLRESMEEVLEILDYEEKKIIETLGKMFGESGSAFNNGALTFSSLYLQDWKEIKDEYIQYNLNSDPHFTKEQIQSFFTTEIQQTALDENGTAKEGSLRNYRVLKPSAKDEPLHFEGLIYVENKAFLLDSMLKNSSETYWSVLTKAVFNLRFAGTRRNRGFGKIRCSIEEVKAINAEHQKGDSLQVSNNCIIVKLKTIDPVVLSIQLGDQNTVFTEKYFSGNRLKGVLALHYMKKKGLNRSNAHQDEDFRDIFLTGKIIFNSAMFEKTQPLPLHLQKNKVINSEILVNIFENDLLTRPIGGSGIIHGDRGIEKKVPDTAFFFHNSRPIRAAGRSVEDQEEGGIFYYEAIEEGQEFIGNIKGPQKLLQKLTETVGNSFRTHVGRSKAAQYGGTEVKLYEGLRTTDSLDIYASDTYLLTLLSPLILFNECGHPRPDEKYLKKSLSTILALDVRVVKAAASFIQVEQFNTSWESKSGKIPAFKEGSSFVIEIAIADKGKLVGKIEQLKFNGLGEWTEQGFGNLQIKEYDNHDDYTLLDNPISPVNNSVLKTDTSPANEILRRIVFRSKHQELMIKHKVEGLKEAIKSYKIKPLNNHLISRLERAINDHNSTEILEWMERLRTKPAWEAIEKANLDESLTAFYKKDTHYKDKAVLSKTYWLSLFATLRKLNKKGKTINI